MRRDNLPILIGVGTLIAGALLPLLALLPFGWMWLWQNGYMAHWLAATVAMSLVVAGARWWLLRRLRQSLAAKAEAATADVAAAAKSYAPREKEAWEAVEAKASAVDPAQITDRTSMLKLGVDTVEAVAQRMHPDEADPLWKFTVPEALLLVERVSQRLRPLVIENVPFGDRLSIGQMMRIYRWRTVVSKAGQAYDIWRILRVANPIAAATQEIRERLSKVVYEQLRKELATRLAQTYVREVGAAAIDLYSGRLRLSEAELSGHVTRETEAEAAEPPEFSEPLRILFAGQTGAGKSSLVNALASELRAAVDPLPATRDFATYELKVAGDAHLPALLLIDSPGLGADLESSDIANKAQTCDLLVWVAAANRADREADRKGIEAIRDAFAAEPHRRPPPILLVLTHIDRLRPLQEWHPPYDIADPQSAKARSIREAMEAAAEDLAIAVDNIVPVCISEQAPHSNVDLVWAKFTELVPDAERARLMRCLDDARGKVDWRRALSQAVGAGRLVTRLIRKPRERHSADDRNPVS